MLDPESFDAAYCHMAMMETADYKGSIAESSRLTKFGGQFVIVTVHPCFDTWFLDRREVAF